MNKCACVYVNDYDSPEFHNAKIQTAKKSHKCSECGEPINIGDRYEYVAGKWDGYFDTFKTCETCLNIRKAFFCDGWNYQGIMEDLNQHIQDFQGEISEDCLVELSLQARAFVCEMIEKYWYEYEDDE